MALSHEDIIKRIQEPLNKDLIAKAISHEERIRFHTQTAITLDDVSSYYQLFLKKIEELLPKDKFERFKHLLDFPIPTNEVCDIIFSELSKIFDAQNRHVSYQFTKPELRDDFQNYLQYLEFDQFWENECMDALRNKINCIQIVDLAITQQTRLPEPYIYNLPIEKVIDVEVSDDGNITFLAFRDIQHQVIVIDDQYYRVYFSEKQDFSDIRLLFENAHGLTWAPCRFFYTDNLNSSNNIVKVSPVTKSLWALDRLLFRMIAKENLEDYAAYPIYSIYDDLCDFQDANGNQCRNGQIAGIDRLGHPYSTACPACKDNFYIGPGTIQTSRPPKSSDTPDLLKNVHVTPADVESLNYNKTSVEERKAEIIQSCVGSNAEQLTGQAQNEKQILSAYETKQAVLMRTKKNFEKAHKFAVDTMAALRYGPAYLGSTIDWGTKFYLATSQQLNEKLKVAKENGASVFEIDMIKSEIQQNEYRNNAEQLERIEILKRLEPFYGLSLEEIQALNAVFQPNPVDLIIKFKFAYFISKFEDDNGSITDFAIIHPMSKRIEIIKNELLKYGFEELQRSGKQKQPADQ